MTRRKPAPKALPQNTSLSMGKGRTNLGDLNVLTLWFLDGLSRIIRASRQSQGSLKAGEEGWRDSVIAKSSNCSRQRPEFRSSHLHGG